MPFLTALGSFRHPKNKKQNQNSKQLGNISAKSGRRRGTSVCANVSRGNPKPKEVDKGPEVLKIVPRNGPQFPWNVEGVRKMSE